MSELLNKTDGKLFDLTRYFSMTSAVAIAVVTIILTVVIYFNAKQNILKTQEEQNIFLTQTIGNTFWPHFSDYVIKASPKDAQYLKDNFQTTEVHELLKIAVRGLPVLKMKIYNLNSLTVYSSDFKQIGVIKDNNQALFKAAKQGITTSKLVHKHSFTGFSGEYTHRDVIESYIPIGRKPDQVEAVFEIYLDATNVLSSIWRKSVLIALGLLFTLGSLYAVLMLIVKRADIIMRDQYSALNRKQIGIRLKNKLLEQESKDRSKAEAALRESEARFRTLIDNIPARITLRNKKGQYLIKNNYLEILYGERASTDKKLKKRFGEHVQNVINSRKTITEQRTRTGADGSEIECEITKFPIFGKSGQVVQIGSITFDISERIKAEKALRDNEARFRSFVENLPFAISIKETDNKYKIINKSFEKWFNVKNDAIIGKTPAQVFKDQKELSQNVTKHNNDVLKQKAASNREQTLLKADGDKRYLDVTKFPILDHTGEVSGIGTICNDVSERIKATNDLKLSEERFRTLFEQSTMGIFVHRQYKPLMANQAAADMYGFNSIDDFLAIDSTRSLSTEDSQTYFYDNLLETDLKDLSSPSNLEHRAVKVDGTQFWARKTSFAIDWDGEPAVCTIREDITEAKDAEEKARQNQERFQTLFEQSNMSIFVHRNFKPLMANPATADMYGYDSVDEFLKIDSIHDLTDPEYHSNLHEQRLKGEVPQTNNEHLAVKKDGTKFWARKRTFVIDWDGEPAACSIREDVSEAKEAEEKARQHQERFGTLFDTALMGIMVHRNHKLIVANDAMANLYGYNSVEEFLNIESTLDLTVPEDRTDGYDKRVRENIHTSNEHRGIKKDGTEFWVRKQTFVIDWEGEPAVCSIREDITQTKEAEGEIERQKILFEAAISNAPYAMLMTNMEREVVLCNPAFLNMFGYEEDEVIGKSTEKFFSDKDEYESRSHLRNLLKEQGGRQADQVTYKRKNGELFPAEMALAVIGDPKEQIFGYIGMIQDISERLKQEQETQQYQQVISDSRRLSLLGEMAAGLAHEINQPLSAITNYTEGCIQRLDNKNAEPDAIRDALKIVTEQADRAGQIINRIRGFVKKEVVEKKKLNTKDIIEEAISLVKPDLERRSVTITTDFENSECPVSVDKIQVQQVILNLIRNASDAMEEQGTKTQNITISTKATEKNTVEISVADTGPGIPKATLNQIFDPFYTTKSSGLGLGLNICQSIIESHGGRMWATSTKKGATIHLTLPLAIKGINNKEKQRAA